MINYDLPTDAEARDAIVAYVATHPGVSVQDVIRDRPKGVSRSQAERAIKDLLYGVPTGARKPSREIPDPSTRWGCRYTGGGPVRGPKRLRSQHPEGTHAFGRGTARLWVIEPS